MYCLVSFDVLGEGMPCLGLLTLQFSVLLTRNLHKVRNGIFRVSHKHFHRFSKYGKLTSLCTCGYCRLQASLINTQDYCFFFTFPSSGILETRKHDVLETGSVSVLRWKGGEDTYSAGPCECGRSYIGETSSPLAVRLREHRHNLQLGLLEKSKLAQHAYEEGHRVGWNDARVLEIESNSRYRKYKESAHMACLTNSISQPSLDISPIWTPLLSNEVSNSQRRSVWRDRFSIFVHKFQSWGLTPQMVLVVDIICLHKFVHFFALMLLHLVFVGYVCSKNVYLLFHPSSTHVSLSQFLLCIFLLSPAELAWSRVIK
jgi:hypothetical protein